MSAIPVGRMPLIFERVLQALPPEDYDIYEIQNLIVTNALDEGAALVHLPSLLLFRSQFLLFSVL